MGLGIPGDTKPITGYGNAVGAVGPLGRGRGPNTRLTGIDAGGGGGGGGVVPYDE